MSCILIMLRFHKGTARRATFLKAVQVTLQKQAKHSHGQFVLPAATLWCKTVVTPTIEQKAFLGAHRLTGFV